MIGSHLQAVGEALWRRALISLSRNQKRGEKEREKNNLMRWAEIKDIQMYNTC